MTRPESSLKIEQPPATLRDLVLERMRTAIIEGHFKSGERLVERSLCDQLGVSRTVVRESIRYLEAEGLVETLPHRGPIVARMEWSAAEEIYAIRSLLETRAAACCAERVDDPVRDNLSGAFQALEAAYDRGETGDLFRATTGFYRVIFESAGHHVAWEIVQRLNGRISRLRAMTLATTDRHRSGRARLQAIRDAIDAGDPEAAANAVREHLAEAASIARRLFSTDPGAG